MPNWRQQAGVTLLDMIPEVVVVGVCFEGLAGLSRRVRHFVY